VENTKEEEDMETGERKRFFSRELLRWYHRHRRDLPWRRTRDPYHIWVSEIMLQQTRVETVIPYYLRFIERFPTIEALAEAPEDEVLKAWEGLGYYSRARNLQAAVREVRDKYGGRVPDSKEQISALKGIGPYTAGAILSIAFNQPEPAVDGNVMRVLARYFLLREDIARGSTRVYMEQLARELIPPGAAADFNQALMELGATVCTPKAPHCLTCPVMAHCAGRLAGEELELPVKSRAKAPRLEHRLAAIVEGSGEREGCIAVRQRGEAGLLARMWELPHIETPGRGTQGDLPDDACIDLLRASLKESGLLVEPVGAFANAGHTFSHIHWEMRVFLFRLLAEETSSSGKADSSGEIRWIRRDEWESLAFPNVFIRILKGYFERS
jgi:A/G-specific adenine glycosylase